MLTDDKVYIAIALIIMTVLTYTTRMLPLVLFRKKIKSRFIRSFLFYVPYAVLAAMAFPAIFTSTGNTVASIAGTISAAVVAFLSESLLYTALGAAGSALIVLLLL